LRPKRREAASVPVRQNTTRLYRIRFAIIRFSAHQQVGSLRVYFEFLFNSHVLDKMVYTVWAKMCNCGPQSNTTFESFKTCTRNKGGSRTTMFPTVALVDCRVSW
jgi:hypothetical protein